MCVCVCVCVCVCWKALEATPKRFTFNPTSHENNISYCIASFDFFMWTSQSWPLENVSENHTGIRPHIHENNN